MTEPTPPALDEHRLRQYLSRLGYDEPPAPIAHELKALHRAHLCSVPFENLDIHLGRQIHLDLNCLMVKLLDRNRGGYCYELNGAFASFLTTLGFDVAILEARVFSGSELGIRFDHACLLVRLEIPWLVDVGFGASFEYPLRFLTDAEQRDPAGLYRIVQRIDGTFDVEENGTPVYRLSLVPRALEEFSDANGFQQSSPASHHTRKPVCSLSTERGRVTVQGLRLIETADGERKEVELTPGQLGTVLADRFGVELEDEDLDRLARNG